MVRAFGALLATISLLKARGCRIIAYAGGSSLSARKLLLDTENNLVELAYDYSFLPGVQHSKHYDRTKCALRNANENRDGWGVAWYMDGEVFPRRFRTSESLLSVDNTTSPSFTSLLDGHHEISLIGQAREDAGGFSHSQGFLGRSSLAEVGSCG